MVSGMSEHVWVEKRELPSAESKSPVRRDVFLAMMGVGQSSAEWPFLYSFIVDVQGLSGSQAEWSFPFCSVSNVQWGSANQVRPNGHLSYCPMLMPSQSFFFCCFFCSAVKWILVLHLLCLYVFCSLLTYLVSWISSKNSKKKGKSAACYFISHFGMNWIILH